MDFGGRREHLNLSYNMNTPTIRSGQNPKKSPIQSYQHEGGNSEMETFQERNFVMNKISCVYTVACCTRILHKNCAGQDFALLLQINVQQLLLHF